MYSIGQSSHDALKVRLFEIPELLRRMRHLLRVYYDAKTSGKRTAEFKYCDYKDIEDTGVDLHELVLTLQYTPGRLRELFQHAPEMDKFVLDEPIDVGVLRERAYARHGRRNGDIPNKHQYLEARVGGHHIVNVHRPDVGCLYEDIWDHSLAYDELRSARLVLLIYYCRCLVAHADTAGEAAEGLEGAVDVAEMGSGRETRGRSYVPNELLVGDPVLVLVRARLSGEQLRPLAVKVDQVARELKPLGLVLQYH